MLRLMTRVLAALVLCAGAAAAQTSNMNVGGLAQVAGATMTKSSSTSAYSLGKIICQSATAASCSGVPIAAARNPDFTGLIFRARLKVNDTGWAGATVRVRLHKDAPTFAAGDGGTYSGNVTDSNYFCRMDVTLDDTWSDPYVKGIGVPDAGSFCVFDPSTGTRNVYATFEARSAVASPAASKTFTVILEELPN